MPALPLGDAGKYVAAAYVVFFALVLIYVSIMAIKLSRLERELAELNELADRRLGSPAQTSDRDPAAARASTDGTEAAASGTSTPSAASAAPAAPAAGSRP